MSRINPFLERGDSFVGINIHLTDHCCVKIFFAFKELIEREPVEKPEALAISAIVTSWKLLAANIFSAVLRISARRILNSRSFLSDLTMKEPFWIVIHFFERRYISIEFLPFVKAKCAGKRFLKRNKPLNVFSIFVRNLTFLSILNKLTKMLAYEN